jgi:hypothetical protein
MNNEKIYCDFFNSKKILVCEGFINIQKIVAYPNNVTEVIDARGLHKIALGTHCKPKTAKVNHGILTLECQ